MTQNGNGSSSSIPSPGDIVDYYADHEVTAGMKSNDREKPFVALVVDASEEEGTVALVVFDHQGVSHALQSVPVTQLSPPEPAPETDEAADATAQVAAAE